MDLMESLNRQLAGWAAFYQYTDYTAIMFRKVDRIVFWKLGYWLARKYRRGLTSLMRKNEREDEPGRARTGDLEGQNSRGWDGAVGVRRVVTSRQGSVTWRNPVEENDSQRDEVQK